MFTDDYLKQAFADGYDAGWEFHLGSGKRTDNPYIQDWGTEAHDRWQSWQDGWDRAGEDS